MVFVYFINSIKYLQKKVSFSSWDIKNKQKPSVFNFGKCSPKALTSWGVPLPQRDQVKVSDAENNQEKNISVSKLGKISPKYFSTWKIHNSKFQIG